MKEKLPFCAFYIGNPIEAAEVRVYMRPKRPIVPDPDPTPARNNISFGSTLTNALSPKKVISRYFITIFSIYLAASAAKYCRKGLVAIGES